MSFLNTITRYATNYQARRRQLRTYLEIANLPRAIQKDIGWPDTFDGSRFTSAVPARNRH